MTNDPRKDPIQAQATTQPERRKRLTAGRLIIVLLAIVAVTAFSLYLILNVFMTVHSG